MVANDKEIVVSMEINGKETNWINLPAVLLNDMNSIPVRDQKINPFESLRKAVKLAIERTHGPVLS